MDKAKIHHKLAETYTSLMALNNDIGYLYFRLEYHRKNGYSCDEIEDLIKKKEAKLRIEKETINELERRLTDGN